jgi:hypothetical protein
LTYTIGFILVIHKGDFCDAGHSCHQYQTGLDAGRVANAMIQLSYAKRLGYLTNEY